MLARITNNLGIKALSALLGIGIWFWIASGSVSANIFPAEIEVEAQNVAVGYVATYPEREVKLKISTQQPTLRKLSAHSFRAFVDLQGLPPGSHEVPIQAVSLEPEVQVLRVIPPKTIVTIEKTTRVGLPVTVRVEGKAGEGFVPDKPVVDPKTVTMIAPKSIAEQVKAATARVLLQGETELVTTTAELVALDSSNNPYPSVSFDPPIVTVELPIVKAAQSKVVGIKAITFGRVKTGYYVASIAVEPPTLAIIGPADVLLSISGIETNEIPLDGLSQSLSMEATLKLPPGVSHESGKIPTVRLTVNIEALPTEKEVSAGFEFINLGSGLKLKSYLPLGIKVLLGGPASVLQNLQGTDVVARVNLSALEAPGSYAVDIDSTSIKAPQGVRIIGFNPSVVTVDLQ